MTTLYARLADDLASHIASGKFPVGSTLPTEMELAEHYQASRQTIRTALRELQDLGLVSRRKRAGTRVEAVSPKSGFSQSVASLIDLTHIAQSQTRLIRASKTLVADTELAAELGCAPGTKWLRIDLLRLDSSPAKRPVGWTSAYIAAEYKEVPELLKASPKSLISSLIEGRYGRVVAEVEQSVRAVAMPAELASQLAALPGSPSLLVRRRYLDRANEVFEITLTTHPGDRQELSSRLKRDRA